MVRREERKEEREEGEGGRKGREGEECRREEGRERVREREGEEFCHRDRSSTWLHSVQLTNHQALCGHSVRLLSPACDDVAQVKIPPQHDEWTIAFCFLHHKPCGFSNSTLQRCTCTLIIR